MKNKYTTIYLIVAGIGLASLMLLDFAKIGSIREIGDFNFFYFSSLAHNGMLIMPALLVIDMLWALGRKKYFSFLTFVNMVAGCVFYITAVYMAALDGGLVYGPGMGLIIVEVCLGAMIIIAFMGRRERNRITKEVDVMEEGK